jgi:hypothetical protein
LTLRDWLHEPLRQVWPWAPSIKEIDLSENGNPEPAAAAGVRAPKHGFVRRVLAGGVVAFAAILGLSLIGIGAASAATHAAPAGGHAVAGGNGGGSGSGGGSNGGGGGGGGGTWDQAKVPLPHQPGQPPVFFIVQSATVADVVALDQTSEAAADASMIAFYQNNTACTVDTHPHPSVQDTITCPGGTATTTDAFADGTWVHVFRLVH